MDHSQISIRVSTSHLCTAAKKNLDDDKRSNLSDCCCKRRPAPAATADGLLPSQGCVGRAAVAMRTDDPAMLCRAADATRPGTLRPVPEWDAWWASLLLVVTMLSSKRGGRDMKHRRAAGASSALQWIIRWATGTWLGHRSITSVVIEHRPAVRTSIVPQWSISVATLRWPRRQGMLQWYQ